MSSIWSKLVNLAGNITGTLGIGNGGTGQTTANAALNALLPSQATANGQVLGSNGTNSSWVAAGLSTALTTNHLFIGNAGVATDTAVTGDITFTGGATTLASTISGAKVFSATTLALTGPSSSSVLNLNTSGSSSNTNILFNSQNSGSVVKYFQIQNDQGTTGFYTTDGGQIATITQAGVATFQGQLIGKGTATNNNATTGYIGETLVQIGTGQNAPTSTQWGDAAPNPITFTGGDFIVNGTYQIARNGATYTSTNFEIAFATTSGTGTTGIAWPQDVAVGGTVVPTSFTQWPMRVGPIRVQSDGTNLYINGVTYTSVQTLYLKIYPDTYSGGPPTVKYSFIAERIR